MDLQEAYLTLHEASGIEAGDKVDILRLPTGNSEGGWTHMGLDPNFHRTLGLGIVRADAGREGFRVRHLKVGDNQEWPFFCLELIEKGTSPFKIGDNEVKFTAEGIKVGCQSVTTEEVDEIHRRLHERP